ncbi:TerC family protein [Flavobacterium sp. CS20]|jgi:predicted tellurium resistance membrane protein TerC|uniref:TerC family protein n=1 Tax=Flavobacterium sp. CS20 TaxID=2775246 RepID=UPI001B3A1480|nr:TerC family protein [Flavobacterium sp. CS20]QTY26612.1 TerC family protein [Flavobacterium sp. CS20]
MEIFLHPEIWISLLTLIFMEIVLGIDNIIFISIVSGKLPKNQQQKSIYVGLTLALLMRIALLFSITWIIGLTEPVLSIYEFDLSWRDIILAIGGIFLIIKSIFEIHHKIEGDEKETTVKKVSSFSNAIIQIVGLDIVFSFDSILTAVGLTEEIILMIIAVIISIIIMMIFAKKVSNFVNKYPTIQILALSFLILIGFMLFVESLHYHVPKGYIYFAVFFSLIIEMLNIRFRKNRKQK